MQNQEFKTNNRQLKTKNPPKVFVGISGGVDSAVSAGLLKKQGFDVVGVFIKIWKPSWQDCPMKEDRLSAMRVCAHLEIPFQELDLTREYEKEVIENMIAEYKAGRTPNPDVICNKEIKFGKFFDWAISHGADFVATGHYACVVPTQVCKVSSYKVHKDNIEKHYRLLTSHDSTKDQTYFLWALKQKNLAKTFFPVGSLEKSEVRNLAQKFGLPNAKRKDSQGLCFVGKVDIKEFLSHYIKSQKGDVFNVYGKKIGWHIGAEFLTIGERHGFTITEKTPNDKPYFVVGKDISKNKIIVSQKNKSNILPTATKEVCVGNINWISNSNLEVRLQGEILARVRYRQPLQKVRIKKKELKMKKIKNLTLEFENPQITAPGQSIVFYHGDECLGGGVIIG